MVPVLKEYQALVTELMQSAADDFVFGKVPNGMDVHSYRAEYATALYERLRRPIFDIPYDEKYFCRKDRRGTVLDKRAMMAVSQALGHNRISVIAEHYLIGVR